MGFLSRLFGDDSDRADTRQGSARTAADQDQQALERYRYLLRTAPPERVEEVHREAFAQLTPQQRQLLYDELSASVPTEERPASADPAALATAATRAEIRQPGTVEASMNRAQARLATAGAATAGAGATGATAGPGASAFAGSSPADADGQYAQNGRASAFGNQGGGMGFGSMFASSMLGSVAGYVIGSAIMSSFLPMFDGFGADAGSDASADSGSADAGTDASADAAASDGGGGWFDDFGGGDFGGFDV